MSPAETLAWRNLPAAAQAALAACPGPGYLLRPDGSTVVMLACPGLPPGFGWCPADTGEVLEVAHAHGAIRPRVSRCGAGFLSHADNVDALDHGYAPARLAALRLLASVSS